MSGLFNDRNTEGNDTVVNLRNLRLCPQKQYFVNC